MAVVTSSARASRPHQPAVKDDVQRLSWSEADVLLNRLVNTMLAADLGDSERVGVFAENSSEVLLTHIGGLLAGVSTVPISFHLGAEELAFIVGDSGTRYLMAGPETIDRAVEASYAVPGVTVVAWRCGSRPGVLAWDDWLAEQPHDDPPTNMRPLPMLVYTSGTTGFPKAVVTPPTLFSKAPTIEDHIETLANGLLAGFDRHLVVGPLYHTGPLTAATVAFAASKPVTILGRFDAERTLEAVERDRIEATSMVPTHFVRMLALPKAVRERYDVSSLKFVAHTGAACPTSVKRAMIEWLGPVLYEAYGATEVGATAAIGSDEWLEYPGSVGRALPPFEALVLDEHGHELPRGIVGRLYFRDATGRGIMYHDDPEKSAEVHVAPGVFTLGEMGFVDDDGYMFITDRFSDMVVSGGVNVYPAEAEQVLVEHRAVEDVAVIGVPCRDMGEELKALVVARDPSVTEADLVAFCRSRIAHYKCPRSVAFVESVGRSAMGKINKRELRRRYWPAERTIG
ncbi:MAG: AMP-binding protein [Acidimicrobiia bacterium]